MQFNAAQGALGRSADPVQRRDVPGGTAPSRCFYPGLSGGSDLDCDAGVDNTASRDSRRPKATISFGPAMAAPSAFEIRVRTTRLATWKIAGIPVATEHQRRIRASSAAFYLPCQGRRIGKVGTNTSYTQRLHVRGGGGAPKTDEKHIVMTTPLLTSEIEVRPCRNSEIRDWKDYDLISRGRHVIGAERLRWPADVRDISSQPDAKVHVALFGSRI